MPTVWEAPHDSASDNDFKFDARPPSIGQMTEQGRPRRQLGGLQTVSDMQRKSNFLAERSRFAADIRSERRKAEIQSRRSAAKFYFPTGDGPTKQDGVDRARQVGDSNSKDILLKFPGMTLESGVKTRS